MSNKVMLIFGQGHLFLLRLSFHRLLSHPPQGLALLILLQLPLSLRPRFPLLLPRYQLRLPRPQLNPKYVSSSSVNIFYISGFYTFLPRFCSVGDQSFLYFCSPFHLIQLRRFFCTPFLSTPLAPASCTPLFFST